jgi:hypothetical protein
VKNPFHERTQFSARDRRAGADGARHANQDDLLKVKFCQPMALTLPVLERQLRQVAAFWAAPGQAAACRYL